MPTNLRKDAAAVPSFVVLSAAKIKKNWFLWQCGFFYTQDVKLIQLSVGLSFSDTNVATAAGSLTGNSWIKTACVIVLKTCWNRVQSLLAPPT